MASASALPLIRRCAQQRANRIGDLVVATVRNGNRQCQAVVVGCGRFRFRGTDCRNGRGRQHFESTVAFRWTNDDLDQRIILVARPRHFGGAQWYFVCPVMNRRASALWMPPGAERFCSRQTWGRRVVAYRSQFRGADDRAHAGKARIKVRLIGDCDPDEWDLPPKPKWMRWRTYNRYVDRYDAMKISSIGAPLS